MVVRKDSSVSSPCSNRKGFEQGTVHDVRTQSTSQSMMRHGQHPRAEAERR